MFGDSMEFGDMNSTVVTKVDLNQYFIPCTVVQTGKSEKLVRIKGNIDVVTLVTKSESQRAKGQLTRERRDNDVPREQSERAEAVSEFKTPLQSYTVRTVLTYRIAYRLIGS